jgi:hypothetical protein
MTATIKLFLSRVEFRQTEELETVFTDKTIKEKDFLVVLDVLRDKTVIVCYVKLKRV